MKARLSTFDADVYSTVEQDYANTWGYFFLKDENLCIPIGFSGVGLSPEIMVRNAMVLIGITDEIIGCDLESGKEKFRFIVPSVFHEFLDFEGDLIVFQDETGFVGLSLNGSVKWMKLCDDVVGNYTLQDGVISGKTVGGESFEFVVGQAD
jgi:hypothetical protein